MSPALDAWLYGTHVATFSPAAGRSSPGVRMTWASEAAERWGDGSVVLSHLLPTGADPHRSSPG
ncbi:hypothetical protein [Cellulomonas marina]|uniref:Uncharacterized protein n=1 Tax=Cellulomonas marina TaxID=988821 RepID=A0A1I1ADD6_9CELL|nr:hypothetical protein [Cellulomonas marina]SFB34528.1 hypothetical protein SAMN05421867_11629 [Cellulomonas marina]